MLPREAQVIASPMYATRLRPAPWHPDITPRVLVAGVMHNREWRRAPMQTAQRRADQCARAKRRAREERDAMRALYRADRAAAAIINADMAEYRAAVGG